MLLPHILGVHHLLQQLRVTAAPRPRLRSHESGEWYFLALGNAKGAMQQPAVTFLDVAHWEPFIIDPIVTRFGSPLRAVAANSCSVFCGRLASPRLRLYSADGWCSAIAKRRC